MPELMKNKYYNRESLQEMALRFQAVYQPFSIDDFVEDVIDKTWDALELKARMRQITVNLGKHLPADYEQALGVIDKVIESYAEGHNDFALMCFRKHYPGTHSVTLIVNGSEKDALDFEVLAAK